jgi:hypothetical protein
LTILLANFVAFRIKCPEMNVYRLQKEVHTAFDSLLDGIRDNYHLQADGFHNRLISVRNEIAQMVWKAENEYVAMKKYNILIDFLSKENERIVLNNIDTPYWMKGEIEYERPPGITQAEFEDLVNAVGAKFRKVKQSIPWHEISVGDLSAQIDGLQFEINLLLKDAFCLPNRNVKFTKGLYDRSMVVNPFFKQNTPCEICGENRAIDACHIIPNHMGGNIAPGNVLWLCPTHHRLFDRFLLSKDEYEKIDWQAKSKSSANFAYLVFRPVFEKFWETMEEGVYDKNGYDYSVGNSLKVIEEMIIDMVHESSEIDIRTISLRMEISQPECRRIVKKMASDGKFEISGSGNFKIRPK